jgi:hypothetical protein
VDVRIPERCILVAESSSRKEADPGMPPKSTLHTWSPTGRPSRWPLVAIAGALATGSSVAVELLSLAPASITAEDAARHVRALADDTFEGREGGSRGGRAAAAYILDQIKPLGYEPAGNDGSYYQGFGGGLRNILAFLPGSDPKLAAEVVVVGAHYDHVGYGTQQNSFGPFGFVHNGADDNASGVAGLVELMEAVRRLPHRCRRPILFAFWDGEEKGLLGSRHFLRMRPPLLTEKRLVFFLNLDMIGRLRERRLTVFGARSASGLRSLLVAANNQPKGGSGLELAFDWDVTEDSDHYAFIMAGIPAVMLHTGLHDQYHRPSDDVEHVNFEGIPRVTRLALAVIAAVADQDDALVFRPASRSESNITRRRFEEERPANRPPQGRWGILSRSDPADLSLPIVIDVARNSPADRAGLRAGDRILTVAGERITDQSTMIRTLGAMANECVIEVERRGLLQVLEMQDSKPDWPSE